MIKRILFILLGVVLFALFLTQTTLGQLLLQGKNEMIAEYITGLGPASFLLAFLFIVIQTFFPFVPFIVLAGVNVLLFGLWGGFLLSWLASSIGATLAFFTARYVARDWAVNKVAHLPIIQKINSFAETKGFLTVLLCRLSTLVPSSVVNLASGISHIKQSHFITATFLGNLPIVFLESWLGHFVIHLERQHIVTLLIIGTIAFILFTIRKKLKRIPS